MPTSTHHSLDAETLRPAPASAMETTRSRRTKSKPRRSPFPKDLIPLIPVLSALPFATSLTDAANNYLYVNKAFECKYGRTLASLKGRAPDILWPQRTPASEAFLKNLQTATRKGGWCGQLVNISRKGQLLHIALRSIPFNLNPTDTFFLGIACDAGDEDKRDRAILKVLFDHLILQAARLTETDTTGDAALLAHQPKRRCEIYRLLRQGLNNKEIAHALNITAATVRVVVSDLRRQLGETHVPYLRHD
jgi:PAS domain S-box-containing protein